jgi:type IV pilus assembly protein PilY1
METKSIDVTTVRTARKIFGRACHLLAAAAYAALTATAANAQISQTPLYLGGGNVPGNLLLTPSVEWPTINSVANLGNYDEARVYAGYFNAAKCYLYNFNATEANQHFYPNSNAGASNHRCSGSKEWSGNFMNWAATQTIDPFRKTLTGGYRVVDTATETVLEKARHDGQGGNGIFPDRRVPNSGNNSTVVDGATPFTWNFIQMRIQGLGNRMYFTRDGNVNASPLTPVQYNPAAASISTTSVYWVNVRIKVCVAGHLETNCRAYSSASKPEGLIQQYADELRIGVFGYLNDSVGPSPAPRDGGVLRARQKFVGPTMIVPNVGETSNPNTEWNTTTGVFITNPDAADATASSSALGITIGNSGAINYLNKFGQQSTNATTPQHKSFDPVSELYYSALRYLKHQGNVADYSTIPGATSADATKAADGFPVITDWDDPIQYACQKNVILGIGDVYTHRDKNLPGNTSYLTEEPSTPGAVSSDTTVNVLTATNKVGELEGFATIGNNNSWSGRNNSAYIAGLAYIANATDIRPENELPGMQTVSTHWVDVLEAQTLEARNENQYYLATKYGGLKIPKDVTFDPMNPGTIPTAWWHTNGDTLTTFGNANADTFSRPDNYYLAGGASQMVTSLQQAFAQIALELRSSASSVAANSTRVDSDTAVFQAAFNSAGWSGELKAFRIETDGDIVTTPAWDAAAVLDALSEANIDTRKIYTVQPPTTVGGALISTTGVEFKWAQLDTTTQQNALRKTAVTGTLVTTTLGQERLDFLRGKRAKEIPAGPYRARDSRLGDIINSDPQFVHKQDFGYRLLAQSAAFSSTDAGPDYDEFRQSEDYLGRTPMVVVGANDGMLHGFDASVSGGGSELFAFVPHAVMGNLWELTQEDYEHRYFVDSTPRIADVWSATNGWRTLVVGTTGAGGHSVFALDITDPSAMSTSSVLWEFTHPDMGFTRGQPAVVPLPSGEFGVVVTSGYQTGVDDGHIWILDPADGSVIRTIVVPDSGDLGAPLVVDLNGDRVADRIYVGDTDGNLWRFDLVGSDPSAWTAPAGLLSGSDPVPLFVAEDAEGNRQAITAPLTSAFNENGAHMVFFGTGSFYRINDNVVPNDPNVDTFYGVVDRGLPIADRANMVEQEILGEADTGELRARAVSDHEMETSHDGWYLDLVYKSAFGGPGPAGERVVARAIVRGDRVIFASLTPNVDPCDYGGSSWIMELNTFSGGRLNYTVFDVNADGDFDSDDYIALTDEDGEELLDDEGNPILVPVSGIDPDIGITQTPAVVGINEGDLAGDEIKVVSGSSGELIRIAERGGVGIGRQSWRELR